LNSPQPSQSAADSTPETWTILRILNWTTERLKQCGIESARLESEILLAHARNCSRIELYTNYSEVVSDQVRAKMRELVKRRVKQEPVAYLVEQKEFYSLSMRVRPGVFIPRPETETLVVEGLAALEGTRNPKVLELCAGSGCVSVALAKQRNDLRIIAVERDEIPWRTATENATQHQVADRLQILRGDLFSPLDPKETFDLLVSNPPYVRTDEMDGLPEDIKLHEPPAALDGGEDGLDVIRRILERGPDYLNSGAACLIEMDPAQVTQAKQLADANVNWVESRGLKDFTGQVRFLCLKRR